MGHPQSQIVNSITTPQNTSVAPFPTKINTATRTVQVWLPDGYISIHGYTQNGVNYAQVYISTNGASSNARGTLRPNTFDDDGSFTFDENGNMISGSWNRMLQLQNEMAMGMSGLSFWSDWWHDVKHYWKQHKQKIKDCATTAAYIGVVGLATGLGAAVGAVAGPPGAVAGGTIAGLAVGTVTGKMTQKARDNCLNGIPQVG
jgi:hypothetical protein